jgi:hypothetical protein
MKSWPQDLKSWPQHLLNSTIIFEIFQIFLKFPL